MSVTAIILCRENSKRLAKKHLKKIGNLSVIEIIINKLKQLDYVNKIVIATGSKKNNPTYEKFIKKKKIKGVNFFYYNKENKVTERIHLASKKFTNEYTLVISGDCVVLDKNFIDYYFKKIKIHKNYEFIKFSENSKFKLAYEGIIIFKTKSWTKVNRLSNISQYQENPGFIVKNKKKFFKVKYIKAPRIFCLEKRIRLSIDTQSDLDYFRILLSKVIKYENINLLNIKKNLSLKRINSHVTQKNPWVDHNNKIYLLTVKSKKYGLGHYKRALTLKREISEIYSSNIKFINLERAEYKYLKKINNSNIIIDLPFSLLKKVENKIIKQTNKIVLIDQSKSNLKNRLNIIPSLFVDKKIRKKVFYGKNFLIINREVIYEKLSRVKSKNNKILILSGGSQLPPLRIKNQIKIDKDKYYDILVGPYVNLKKSKRWSFTNLNYISNTRNIYFLYNSYEKIITRFGITVYELLGLGIKPYVILEKKDDKIRKKTIKKLYNLGLINIFGLKERRIKKNYKLAIGASNTVKLIEKYFN